MSNLLRKTICHVVFQNLVDTSGIQIWDIIWGNNNKEKEKEKTEGRTNEKKFHHNRKLWLTIYVNRTLKKKRTHDVLIKKTTKIANSTNTIG